MRKAEQIAEELLQFTRAKSVFLYGSRARADFYPGSDYEIGVLMEKDKYIGRTEIGNRFSFEGVNIFPFHYEDFITGNPDTPFQKSIYLRDVVGAGKTLAGEKIIENLKLPEITLLDVIQDIGFNLGYALAATHSYRNGDNATAALHLAKSCLFGTRDYIIFKVGQFATDYDVVVDASQRLDLQEYQDLPVYALQLRKGQIGIDGKNLFRNISYLNKFIRDELLAVFKTEGDKVLVR